MALGSILLILGLLLLVALFVARPIVEDEHLGAGLDPQRSHWIAEREQALEALLELDFDQELGKVPPEIYVEQRQQLLRQGAEALRQLEAPQVEPPKPVVKPSKSRQSGSSDADLEAMIARRKKKVG